MTHHTRDWVENWMKGHKQGAEAKASVAPMQLTKPESPGKWAMEKQL